MLKLRGETMKIAKLNAQGTIAVAIPKDIAASLNWKEGQTVIVSATEDKQIKPINTSTN